MEKAKIVFKNGTEIEAEVNGSSFIMDTKPEIPADLSEVTITEKDNTRILKHAEVQECAAIDSRYWFALYETPENVLKERKMQSDIQYIAMMADIDLEV